MLARVALCSALLLATLPCFRGDEVSEAVELPVGETLCPVKDQGAKGDGRTNDRTAIQKAIDACGAKEQGGVVTFEEGKTYLTGALAVASKVTIRIPNAATLLASSKVEDYPKSPDDWFLLLINKVTRVSIEGPGKIAGQISHWKERLGDQTVLKSWKRQNCLDGKCRPSLIGVRESSQVSLDQLELQDFVHTAISIQRSEAVAVVASQLKSEDSFPDIQGIVIDGSKRVFVGQTSVSCGGSSLSALASTGSKPLESLLVDNVILKSTAAAFQVGPTARTEVKTIVVQNARVETSHRGVSVQLQDSGNLHDVWFTNVTIQTQHMKNLAVGAAECIHVSAKPSMFGGTVGRMSNIWFGNITCVSEGGFVFAGTPEAPIDGVTVKDSRLELSRITSLEGGFRDFRPSKQGLENATTVPAIFLENVNHVVLSGVEVVAGSPSRKEWGNLLEITPHTVHALQLNELHMHDEAAHPAVPFVAPMKKMSQLGDFFGHSIREWANAIGQKGFISLQENAAFGVSGRRAPSSASPAVILLLLIVLLAIFARYCCMPALQRGAKRKGGLLG